MINIAAAFNFFIFAASLMVGATIELLLLRYYFSLVKSSQKINHFSLWKYLYFLILPFLIIVYFMQGAEINFLLITFAFAGLGTTAEWFLGFFYHQMVGEHLWKYHHYPITKYTSWLSIPLWGLSGSIFYLFIQIFI